MDASFSAWQNENPSDGKNHKYDWFNINMQCKFAKVRV
jgi:hypothetical protein